ncbi:family 20 glycosylhydrolase [Streptomyces flavofungini]|uniref:beta-N-acetylhexosaminidase n=1 Tax=Streptomyces flavofungini TaxID=68200 RepID=A0ABS0X2E6_9ACTN|nr:family 20 glycosylhydrolase [Streptomyces flavofungini]MBJ3807352.1 family 20 glycosylhydrolase [Streptomyces flavofungini]
MGSLAAPTAHADGQAPPRPDDGQGAPQPDAGHDAPPPDDTLPSLVPRPTHWTPLPGRTELTPRTRILIDPRQASATALPSGRAEFPGPARQSVHALATRLRTEIKQVTGLTPRIVAGGRPDRDDISLALGAARSRTAADDLGAEGYRFDSAGPVRVTAASTHGLYYGTRTLLQLLRTTAPDHRAVPRARSVDRPTQAIRMTHLDAGRKYWRIPYLKNLIRRMGDQKLNTLFLHLSESEGFRLYSPRFPGLADPEHSYSRADIEDLKAFAARHHVQLMPGLELPGHATVINEAFGIGFGAGPGACTGAHTHSHLTPDWIIDMTSEKAIAKSKEIVDEFAGWFDAPLFSIGAEEVPGQLAECPRVKEHLAAAPDVATLGDLLNRYINTLDDVVTSHGRRTAVYNGSEHLPAPQQRVHAPVVFLTWEGTGAEPAIPGHDEIAIGPFYNTPNNYHHKYPDEPWMYDSWTPSSAPDMLGSGVVNWADYNFWADDGYFEQHLAGPRAILADRTWNGSPTPDTVTAFHARVERVGDPPDTTPAWTRPRVTDRPSHHWTFDDAAYPKGWTYAGSPGNTIFAADVAGDLPGTSYIIDNPTPVPGEHGQAWRFDSDRDGVGFGGGDVAAPWTVSVLVRPSARTGDQVLLSSRAGALKLMQHGTGRVGLTRYGEADFSFPYTLPLDRWTRLTWVATENSTVLYADGVRVGAVPASIPLPMRSIGSEGAALRGDLDDLATWDVALGPPAVARLR